MNIASRISTVLVLATGLSGVGFVGIVLAQNSAPAAPVVTQTQDPHAMMMAEMKASQERLDELVVAMNSAPDAERNARMAAVLTELVAQHKRMTDQMAGMEGNMMQMMMRRGSDAPSDPAQHHP